MGATFAVRRREVKVHGGSDVKKIATEKTVIHILRIIFCMRVYRDRLLLFFEWMSKVELSNHRFLW